LEKEIPAQRVAVLVSGQVRSDNSDIEKIAEACQQVNADVFLCVWRKRGAKGLGGGQGLLQLARAFGNRFALAIPRNWIGANMRKVFPVSDHLFPDLGSIQAEQMAEIFPGAHIEIVEDQDDLTIPYMDSNSLRMLYMINKCNEMKREAEARGGFTYDVVARHRPDVKMDYTRAIDRFNADKKTVFPKSDLKNTGQLHDIFWVGSSEEDDTLSRLYFHANATRKEGWKGIHFELRDWTEKHSIDLVMFNCLTAGINDASFKNNDIQLAAAQKLLDAVRDRKLDIEAAGGDIFCETFTPVFEAIMSGQFPQQSTLTDKLVGVLNQNLKPKQSLFLIQGFCWQICFNEQSDLVDRLGAFLAAQIIDGITNNQNAADWSATAFPQLFAEHAPSKKIVELLLSNGPKIRTESPISEALFNYISDIGNKTHDDINALASSMAQDILFKHQNWKWIFSGLENEKEFGTIILLAESQLDAGKYVRGLVSTAIRAGNRVKDDASVLRMLQKSTHLENTAQTHTELGQFLMRSGNLEDAKRAFVKASSFKIHSPSVEIALSKL